MLAGCADHVAAAVITAPRSISSMASGFISPAVRPEQGTQIRKRSAAPHRQEHFVRVRQVGTCVGDDAAEDLSKTLRSRVQHVPDARFERQAAEIGAPGDTRTPLEVALERRHFPSRHHAEQERDVVHGPAPSDP